MEVIIENNEVISDSNILRRYLQNLIIVLNLEGRQTPKIGEEKY